LIPSLEFFLAIHAGCRSIARVNCWREIFLGMASLGRQNSGSDAHAHWGDAMIEIIVLRQLGRRIAQRARVRGRRGGLYVLLLLAFWFSGEVAGAAAAGAVMVALGAKDEDYFPIAVYAAAIAGAAAGAWIAFAIASRGPVIPIAGFDDDPVPVIEAAETN
jgi:hypothetical protein